MFNIKQLRKALAIIYCLSLAGQMTAAGPTASPSPSPTPSGTSSGSTSSGSGSTKNSRYEEKWVDRFIQSTPQGEAFTDTNLVPDNLNCRDASLKMNRNIEDANPPGGVAVLSVRELKHNSVTTFPCANVEPKLLAVSQGLEINTGDITMKCENGLLSISNATCRVAKGCPIDYGWGTQVYDPVTKSVTGCAVGGCNANYAVVGNGCQLQCPSGYVAQNNNFCALQCAGGYYPVNNQYCQIQCPAGYHATSATTCAVDCTGVMQDGVCCQGVQQHTYLANIWSGGMDGGYTCTSTVMDYRSCNDGRKYRTSAPAGWLSSLPQNECTLPTGTAPDGGI